jgi:16S rRNA (cytosine967-C5)-methyltransferase
MNFDKLVSQYNITLKEKSFIQATCYGVCRNYYLLEKNIKSRLSKKTKNIVMILLTIGLYQLKFMSQPSYAVVNETVLACDDLNIKWATKFVNAILRNFVNIEITPNKFLAETEYSFQSWMFNIIKKNYPDEWRVILKNSNAHPPMFLRVNTSKIKTYEYLSLLIGKGIPSHIVPHLTKKCIQLATPINVNDIPHFNDGWVTIQDHSAQLAAEILEPFLKGKVLDACAAPGGKTIALLDINKEINIEALDSSKERLDRLQENIQRTFPSIKNLKIICGNAQNPSDWHDNQNYNVILLDAPCSATGVIRRNPDIKILRTELDIHNIVSLQKRILNALWPTLKDGGYLLYVTCSIIPEENHLQIQSFLEKHSNAKEIEIEMLTEYHNNYGYQILPALGDGFYYCLIKKIKI